ncbi:phage terminase, small subunit, putative, P27 family [Streptomyces sp. DI166]|uniref:phage terminase small subunit P27 family n=1 Tax=Streptomyces sp. DI166 TaxID=1839783 RepID=UPI0007F3BCD2|nr:phage terminase small subunit P27 family [Streptomyces sp. DI166]SBT89388.1 phage terminase, small subunit, putative, P27 family [Streptomyces sp. DI166]
MGKRGPAPKPTQLRVLHGDRKDRINTDEPAPSAGEVVPPEWLGAEALDVWEEYAPDLEAKRVLTSWDVEAFAAWCDAVARRRDAARHVEEEGAVVEHPVFNKNGDQTGVRMGKNAWLLALDTADAQVRAYGARFGLTPSDRASLKIPNEGEGLGAERLLS